MPESVECLLLVEVGACPPDQAILELVHERDRAVEVDSACLAERPDPSERHGGVAEVADLLDVDRHVPHRVPVGPVVAQPIVAAVDQIRVLDPPGDFRDPLFNLRMRRLEPRIDVAHVPGLQIPPHGVYVLLGHRPILDTRLTVSQENIEIVRRVYKGWSRGDFSQSELFDPDIEFEMVDWPHPAKVARDRGDARDLARHPGCVG